MSVSPQRQYLPAFIPDAQANNQPPLPFLDANNIRLASHRQGNNMVDIPHPQQRAEALPAYSTPTIHRRERESTPHYNIQEQPNDSPCTNQQPNPTEEVRLRWQQEKAFQAKLTAIAIKYDGSKRVNYKPWLEALEREVQGLNLNDFQ